MARSKKKLLDLRKGVDFIGVTCSFYCHDGQGNILMHKRSRKCRDEWGAWDGGSGSMEFGETFEETVRREIMEEYCVRPTKLVLCSFKNVLRTKGRVKTHWVAGVFVARVNPKHVRIGEPEKMDDIGWFPINRLPKRLHSQTKRDIAIIKQSGVKI